MQTILERAHAWVVGDDTGSSSKALWAKMMGVKGITNHPHDGGDLGRCLRLLELIPEWQPGLAQMATVSPYWAALVEHWAELAALHKADEVERKKRGLRGDFKTYKRMRKILDSIEEKDPRVFRMGEGATVGVGR